MSEMTFTSAQYVNVLNNQIIKVVVDGVELSIPPVAGNRHYDEIMRQVEAGTLTIQEAD
tara:strand:+ start:2656 stop:2832 length:177 start_codon:yes stop_codon:yes gene_type:complete